MSFVGMASIDKLSDWWVRKYENYSISVRIFEAMISLWIMIYMIKILSMENILNDSGSMCSEWYVEKSSLWIANMVPSSWLVPALVSQIVICCLNIIKGSNYLSRFAMWLITINVFSLCPSLYDGGTTLMVILLFLFIFVDGKTLHAADKKSLSNVVSSLAVFAIQFQFAAMYYENALGKLESPHWLSGSVFSYLSLIPEYSTPLMDQFFGGHPILALAATYGTILFEFLFPFMVLTKMRYVWLLFGVILHVSIIIFLGLVSFSIMMIIFYALFIRNNEWVVARNFCSSFYERAMTSRPG